MLPGCLELFSPLHLKNQQLNQFGLRLLVHPRPAHAEALLANRGRALERFLGAPNAKLDNESVESAAMAFGAINVIP